LFEIDLFDQLNSDFRKYSEIGYVYCTGDFNSRTGERSDLIEDLNINRFIAVPALDDSLSELPLRHNDDKTVNSFGNQLLTFCKENCIQIVNGRLESGKCTFHAKYRNKCTQSTVDYVLTHYSNFSSLDKFFIHDMTEFSDHCPVVFTLSYCSSFIIVSELSDVKKLVWNTDDKGEFLNALESHRSKFDDIFNRPLDSVIDINDCTEDLSNIITDISFKSFGKKSFKKRPQRKKCLWFNVECRQAKSNFYNCKRAFSVNKSPH
jgi:hypothetical protein